jgi:hypothetical protein
MTSAKTEREVAEKSRRTGDTADKSHRAGDTADKSHRAGDTADNSWEAEWALEAERRESSIIAGRAQWLSGKDVVARLRSKLA